MSTPNDTRLVPMTRKQRDRLNRGHGLGPNGEVPTALEVVAAWDASPANPAEAAFAAWQSWHKQQHSPGTAREMLDAVLVALGFPLGARNDA